ncbi:hypothetical protein AGMMS50293_08740 [Spirochaetia bacterium]|nr:hypothetical protein AGMMS50293_08740 [Spirochaetia bacterium]
MKKTFFRNIIIFSLPVMLLLSCEALPFNYSLSQSWFIPVNAHNDEITGSKQAKPAWGTVSLMGVQVDRTGGWDSVEREFAALAPLCFWKQGCRVVSGDEQPKYSAGIQVREREYNSGWRTRRSLAVEVRIWAAGNEGGPEGTKLPLAAGRVVSVGERSFSSSDTAGRMLSKAIRKAVKKLRSHELRALKKGN